MRTPLTYYGGKQKVADRIVALMPVHRIYVEPFAGGAAVLFRKPRSGRELLNDLDGAIVAFWRAVRDHAQDLARALELTPYSREDWWACYRGLDADVGDVERARRLITTIDQSFSRCGDSWSPPATALDRRGRWQPGTWENMPAKIVAAATRLQGVGLENTDALTLIGRFDHLETLIYCDPPYTGEHRINTDHHRGYRHDDHPELWPELVEVLLGLQHAQAMVSGYPCEAAEDLERAGWRAVQLFARRWSRTRAGGGASVSPETVWLSPGIASGSLFDEAATEVAA